MEVFRNYDDDEVFSKRMIGDLTGGTILTGTVFPGYSFYGYLEFTHAREVNGSGGFGINGSESCNAAVGFT